MMINSNGVHRKATEQEIAEIESINSTSYDMAKEQETREKARNLVAEKLGLTSDELKSLLS